MLLPKTKNEDNDRPQRSLTKIYSKAIRKTSQCRCIFLPFLR